MVKPSLPRIAPHAIDVKVLCRDAARVEGSHALATLERLAGSLHGAPDTAVTWSAQGSLRLVTGAEPEHWLHLQAQAVVPLQCQRCLHTYAQELHVDRRFLFVAQESLAERLDETLEDDVLVMPVRLDLAELLEDELILALPLVPRHDGTCPQPLPMRTNELEEDAAPNPFAALAALRGRQRDEPGA
jgi:uncharacterized protein